VIHPQRVIPDSPVGCRSAPINRQAAYPFAAVDEPCSEQLRASKSGWPEANHLGAL